MVDLGELKAVVKLVTSLGVKATSDTSIYFPKQYGNSLDLLVMFPSKAFSLIIVFLRGKRLLYKYLATKITLQTIRQSSKIDHLFLK